MPPLPPTLEALLQQEREAAEKYIPLVRRLGAGELLGLSAAVALEMRRRGDIARERIGPEAGRPGSRIGR